MRFNKIYLSIIIVIIINIVLNLVNLKCILRNFLNFISFFALIIIEVFFYTIHKRNRLLAPFIKCIIDCYENLCVSSLDMNITFCNNCRTCCSIQKRKIIIRKFYFNYQELKYLKYLDRSLSLLF